VVAHNLVLANRAVARAALALRALRGGVAAEEVEGLVRRRGPMLPRLDAALPSAPRRDAQEPP
jgi:hypothetical protein